MDSNTTNPKPARWTALVPILMVGLVCLGLVATVGSTLYDLRHWDTVSEVAPENAANNGLADLGAIAIRDAYLAVSVVMLIGLLLSMVGLALGRSWGHGSSCTLIALLTLWCGIPFASAGNYPYSNFDDPRYLNPRGSYAPDWLLVCDTAGPPLIVGGAITALITLLLPPVRRRFRHPLSAQGRGATSAQ